MTKIKICGIRTTEDAIAACRAGADALGFNLSASSPRSVCPDTVRSIVAQLPPFVTTAGVFVEQDPAEINHICSYCGLQVAQLHSDGYTAADAGLITTAQVMKVFRPGPRFRFEDIGDFAAKSGCRWFLFDAYNREMAGGTGLAVDEAIAEKLLQATAPVGWPVLAGGLKPENVGGVVKRLRPWGVDTASGVESAPGFKDANKMNAFVQAVRIVDRSITG